MEKNNNLKIVDGFSMEVLMVWACLLWFSYKSMDVIVV